MELLLDIFGFLTVMLRGVSLTAQSLACGGAIFIAFLALPFGPGLEATGQRILRQCAKLTVISAFVLVAVEIVTLAIQVAILTGTLNITLEEAIGAGFVQFNSLVTLASFAIGVFCLKPAKPQIYGALAAVALLMAASVGTSHAAARVEDRALLLVAAAFHQLGAAVWIGGIPYFLIALARSQDGRAWRRIGKRFSQMSMVGVGLIAFGGIAMAIPYIGSLEAVYGTAYGVMVGTKVALFAALLFLGAMNFRLVERLRANPMTPITRLRRFAEVEIGVGITVLFAAASLTSLPPAIDLTNDRASWSEIVERMTPRLPTLQSPDHDGLAIPALQAKLDAQAQAETRSAPMAFVPGAGELPPRNAADIAWSEYNHHWAGIFVLAIGLLAMLEKTGRAPWAKHWPLLFLGLAGFLFLRSDPEVWPMGDIGFFVSLRDPEVVQHRIMVVLIVLFAIFEWRVRAGGLKDSRAELVFPLICAIGGALLLTHSHAVANIKEQLLIEWSHVPLALAGVAAGWSRWLELRLAAPGNRLPGRIWPLCLTLVGIILLSYRET